MDLLEPVRLIFDAPIVIHSGYRPPEQGTPVGGAKLSDHQTGRAADFHLAVPDWQDVTKEAFEWMAVNLDGWYGQLILEDHREYYGRPSKFWAHAAIPSPKHPGTAEDVNRILLSKSPGIYEPYRLERNGA